MEAVVEYDYDAVNPDELNLKEGEIITNINMLEEGWWEGELNGKRGMFPDNFVKVMDYFENNLNVWMNVFIYICLWKTSFEDILKQFNNTQAFHLTVCSGGGNHRFRRKIQELAPFFSWHAVPIGIFF